MTSQADPKSVAASAPEAALERLLRLLAEREYRFVTPTPASHARVVARAGRTEAADLRDVLGWSLPFREDLLDTDIMAALLAGDALQRTGEGMLKSRYRVSSLRDDLFLHSAYPTEAANSVFFGPDSYRFADLIRRELAICPPSPEARVVDIGAGAGVGAVAAVRACPRIAVVMTDINPAALRLARINAAVAGIDADYVEADSLAATDGQFDVALANPPYIIDDAGRDYRNGGGHHGAQAAYRMAEEAAARLAPGGRLILYTGSAIVQGKDWLNGALTELAARAGATLRYREIDPDVFGEELAKPAYADVDRIALVAAVISG